MYNNSLDNKNDRIFFRKLISKSNVGATLQIYEIQLNYLLNAHKMVSTMGMPLDNSKVDRDHTKMEITLKIEVSAIYQLIKKHLIRNLPDISVQTEKDLQDLIAKILFYANWYGLLRSLSSTAQSDQKKDYLQKVLFKLKTKRFETSKARLEAYYQEIRVCFYL